MKNNLLAIASVALLLLGASAHAASNRMALVIGNADYESMPLKNPGNDARAVAKALTSTGFRVITLLDADLGVMQSGVLDFVSKLSADSTALVFYAGHGMQANGRNYLLPVGAEIDSERALKFQALDLTDLLEEMEASGSRINVVILDACRNNPFERKLRGRGRGLAAVDAASGTLIAYATAPGSTASDGAGENGLYTTAFLSEMTAPGRSVEEVFKRVRIAVSEASAGEQVPWESSSLTGNFSFVSAGQPSVAPTPAPLVSAAGGADREVVFWESIKDSDDVRLYEAYLDQYPRGTFATIAQLKIDGGQADESDLDRPAAVSGVGDALVPAGRSDGQSCADLAGRWHHNVVGPAATCSPKNFLFKPAGPDRYVVQGRACAKRLKAMAQLVGNKLQMRWRVANCSGVTEYEMDEGCLSGSGRIKTKRSLLCKERPGVGAISRH